LLHGDLLQPVRKGVHLLRVERGADVVRPVEVDHAADVVLFDHLFKVFPAPLLSQIDFLVIRIRRRPAVHMHHEQLSDLFFQGHPPDFALNPSLRHPVLLPARLHRVPGLSQSGGRKNSEENQDRTQNGKPFAHVRDSPPVSCSGRRIPPAGIFPALESLPTGNKKMNPFPPFFSLIYFHSEYYHDFMSRSSKSLSPGRYVTILKYLKPMSSL